jgi:hypothetical protein
VTGGAMSGFQTAGILYALHIRAQKYGFYPIFLLFLQVGEIKPEKLSKRQ